MKKVFIILFVAILFLVFLYNHNNNPKVILSRLIKKGGIQSGELIYRVSLFGVMPVGDAIFALEKPEDYNGQEVYHLSATAKPLAIYSKLFKGYALLDSYIDTKTGNPILFKQKIVAPGKEAVNKEVLYDQKNGVMTIAGTRRNILADTQDPLSAIYHIRRMDFDKVKEFEISLNTNQKNYVLKGAAQPQEICIDNKKYKIFILKSDIRRRDKNPYHQTKLTMTLCKEKENIPILIKVFASGALINARLVEIK